MTSLPPDVLGSQIPRVHCRPEAVRTDGGDAAALAASYGLVLDGWQRLVLDDWLAVRPDGRRAASTCWLSVPRQNGKTAIVEAFELFSLAILGHRILYTAQELPGARRNFESLLLWFGRQRNDPAADHPELNALVWKVSHTNGREEIKLKNGGWIQFSARTRRAFRGGSIDVLILDEAQLYDDEQHAALGPTLRASPDAQKVYLGTPPDDGSLSAGPFGRMRQAGIAGTGSRLAFAEWSAEPGEDPYAFEAWVRSNPGLGVRISAEDMRESVDNGEYSREDFQRELLGTWLEGGASELFGPGRWAACGGEVPDDRTVGSVGIAVSVTLGSASVALGAKGGDRVMALPSRIDVGTEWLVSEAVGLAAKHRVPLALDGGGPGAFLLPSLKAEARKAGVRVVPLSLPNWKDACAAMHRQVADKDLLHANWPELDAAVAAATRREIGDRWAWGRRGEGDISMLEAATVALWAQDNARTRSAVDQRLAEGRPAVMSV